MHACLAADAIRVAARVVREYRLQATFPGVEQVSEAPQVTEHVPHFKPRQRA